MSPQYTNFQQMVSSLGEKKITEIVNSHFERVKARQEYNETRSKDPKVKKDRQKYQADRNAKIKRALQILAEREKLSS